jgi:hypothetical protein
MCEAAERMSEVTMQERPQITCLRCRQCSKLPQTDLRDARTLVWCGKINERREINLHGCLVADANFMYRSPQHAHFKPGGRPGGDKLRSLGEIEVEYFRLHYPTMPVETLAVRLGRSVGALRRIGWRNKITGHNRAYGNHRATQQARGHFVNDAQSAYICSVAQSEVWPIATGNKSDIERNAQKRAAIVSEVAKLGHPFGWRTIQCHASYHSAGRRLKRARLAKASVK